MAMMLAITSLSGCFFRKEVQANQIGLLMADGVSITEVVGAGRYTNMSFYADAVVIDASAKTVVWTDADMMTSDKQVIGIALSVSYTRDRDLIEMMWSDYNSQARSDEALEALVLTRIPRVAKQLTTSMTLDAMLGISEGTEGNRALLANNMFDLMSVELAECGVKLLDIGINDISVDPIYAAKLSEKAASQMDVELATARTKQLTEQLAQEVAQTDIDLELARRANQVAEEVNKIYTISPEAYELERLRLLKGLLGNSDKVYFIPEGSDISLFVGGGAVPGIVPAN